MSRIGADSLFAVNFSIDYLLVYGLSRLLGIAGRRRVCLCAALIAFSETLTIFPLPPCVTKILPWAARIVAPAILCLSRRPQSLFKGGVFLLLYLPSDQIVTSGLTAIYARAPAPAILDPTAAHVSRARALPALFTFLSLCTLFCFLKKRKRGGKTVTLTIAFGGSETSCTAFCDAGNFLKDPLSGLPVAVIGRSAARRLGGVSREKLTRDGKLRLVPAKTVAGSALLAAFLPDHAKIDGKTRRICVAIAEENDTFGGHEALVGDDIL